MGVLGVFQRHLGCDTPSSPVSLAHGNEGWAIWGRRRVKCHKSHLHDKEDVQFAHKKNGLVNAGKLRYLCWLEISSKFFKTKFFIIEAVRLALMPLCKYLSRRISVFFVWSS